MKRSLGILLAVAAAASMVLIPSSPASANTDGVCAGQGTAALTTGLSYPLTNPGIGGVVAKSTGFTFSFTAGLGVCVGIDLNAVPPVTVPGKTTLTAGGTVTGWCGLSYSTNGTTTNGHSFSFTSTGTVLILTGELIGAVSAIPDPTIMGNSCNGKPGATKFIITGAVVKRDGGPTTTPPLKTVCDNTAVIC